MTPYLSQRLAAMLLSLLLYLVFPGMCAYLFIFGARR
jgi:hypothetical protein